jgi:hypothetical protein
VYIGVTCDNTTVKLVFEKSVVPTGSTALVPVKDVVKSDPVLLRTVQNFPRLEVAVFDPGAAIVNGAVFDVVPVKTK